MMTESETGEQVELDAVVELLRDWWKDVARELEVTELYLFGSAIYKNGAQFDASHSDLDLVTLMPMMAKDAVTRLDWIRAVATKKKSLELQLLQALQRHHAGKPIVSFIPLAPEDLSADIHKSKVRHFFASNDFMRLSDGQILRGLPGSGSVELQQESISQALQFSQEIRAKYLSIPAAGVNKALEWSSDDEPIPKAVMRTTAQIAAHGEAHATQDERFDVNVGLQYFGSYVFQRRHDDERYRKLSDWLAARSAGRGIRTDLSADMHLFMAEIIFDLAVSASDSLESVVGPAVKSTPLARTELPNQPALKVEFQIGRSGQLLGQQDTLLASIAEAGLNLRWQQKPYFTVAMAEKDLDDEILECEAKGDPESRSRRVELLDEKRWQGLRRNELERGFELLMYYQSPLFPDEKLRSELLVLAMQTYALLCHEKGGVLKFGGPLVASNESMISTPMPVTIKFGLPSEALNRYLSETFGRKSTLLNLAAKNQRLLSFPGDMVAIHVVPLLVKNLVETMSADVDVVHTVDTYVEHACQLAYWTVGVC
ncbi:Uncharacterised protein [Burkholderia pseudomallei]|nr:Uncharacterised protein [Burkholderia pseudomallei]